jgi:hypothetical protein
MPTTNDLATVGAVFGALYAAHQVADHWVQTQWQADHKGQPGWLGRAACLGHVVSYTTAAIVALGLLTWRTGWHPTEWRYHTGIMVSAVTHYAADRRGPLRWLADRTGSRVFYRLGTPREGRDDNPTLGTGAYALDQSWHIGWLFIAALIIG